MSEHSEPERDVEEMEERSERLGDEIDERARGLAAQAGRLERPGRRG